MTERFESPGELTFFKKLLCQSIAVYKNRSKIIPEDHKAFRPDDDGNVSHEIVVFFDLQMPT